LRKYFQIKIKETLEGSTYYLLPGRSIIAENYFNYTHFFPPFKKKKKRKKKRAKLPLLKHTL
jgi:hypothetical protein